MFLNLAVIALMVSIGFAVVSLKNTKPIFTFLGFLFVILGFLALNVNREDQNQFNVTCRNDDQVVYEGVISNLNELNEYYSCEIQLLED